MKYIGLTTFALLIFASCSQTTYKRGSSMTDINTNSKKCDGLYSELQVLNSSDLNSTQRYFYNHRGKTFARIYTAPQENSKEDEIVISFEDLSNEDITEAVSELTEKPFAPTYFISCKFNPTYNSTNYRDMCDPYGGNPLIIGPSGKHGLELKNFDMEQKVLVAERPGQESYASVFPTKISGVNMGKQPDIILLVTASGQVIAMGDNPYIGCRKY